MTSINTSYKANTIDPVAQSGSMDPYLAEIQSQIQEALSEIDQFKIENSEWLTEEQLVQMNRIETMLKAEYAAIQGGGIGGTGALGVDGEGNLLNRPEDLQPEWNGVPADCIDASDAYGQDLVNDDPGKYGEFAGTVNIPNSGNPADPTKIAFQMTDDMDAIYGESRGRDMIITVVDYTYGQDGEIIDEVRRSWVIKEGTVRPEPIIVSALGLSHGVTMDFSRVIRVSTGEYPGYFQGNSQGLYIHGTEFNDDITGSQCKDSIIAYAGNDILDGQGGDDTIYADEYYQVAGQQSMEYGGDDKVKGGTGDDIIYGGGGLDTASKSDAGEAVAEVEGWENDVADASTIPDIDDCVLSPGDDWVVGEIEDGVVVVENVTGDAGEIFMDMPPGYNMALGEMDGDGNLKITFVGDAGTFTVMFEDFFGKFGDDEVVKLVFYGGSGNDIIDFSGVKVNEINGQCISIVDEYNSDDIILGAENALLKDGVDLEEILESQKNSDGELQGLVDEGIFATDSDNYADSSTANGYTSHVEDGQIVIEDDGDSTTDPATKLYLKAPEGYEHGYITSDTAGNIYVIMVKPTESGKAETIVIKIDTGLCGPGDELSYSDIGIKHWDVDDDEESGGSPLALIPISCDMEDYLIDAGAGNDMVFNQKGGYNENAEDEVWIEPEPFFDTTPVSSTPEPEETEPEETEPEETTEETTI